jgi:hypothetical protein
MRPRSASRALVHPVALAALVTWIANDHWGKRMHGGVVTGKLSDIACLIVVPLLVLAILERRRELGAAAQRACLAATGFVMIAINLFDSAAWLYRYGLAVAQWPLRLGYGVATGHGVPALVPVQLTMDPTDVLTLPALLVPWWLLRQLAKSGADEPQHTAVSACGESSTATVPGPSLSRVR